jgi:outer membrane translocation and assembly module TamA
MRGYYEGRFRDKSMITVQGEYRVPLWSRFSLATFAGAGQVAEGPDAFALRDFKYSFGGGVRFALSRQEGINVRCDVGLGEETSGVYLTIGEAF